VVFSKRSAATFAEEQSKASWGSVWFQLIFYALVSAILECVSELITNTTSGGLILIFNIFFFFTPIIFFITTGIYYLLARAFRGQGTFLAQSYTLLLITVPLGILIALLDLIPGIGRVGHALGFYIIGLSIRMIMGVHRLSWGKATAVVLIPVAIISIIAVFIGFAVSPA
jgi:hypothetical protein